MTVNSAAKGGGRRAILRDLLLVLVVSATVLVPGIGVPGLGSLPVVDRDEARFAQASRQMLEAEDLDGWIVPRVGDRPRLNKPPLIYWLQAGTAWVATGGDPARDRIWMYRLPSVLAALFAAGLTWWLGRTMFDRGSGILAGIMLGTCPLVVFDAHQARADEALLACTLAAQAALWWCWRTRGRPGGPSMAATVLLWLCVGLGMLTKGPITPFVTGATALTLAVVDRQWRWLWRLRPWLGLIIVCAMFGPWIGLVVRSVGWESVQRFIDEEIVRRASSGVEGHWGPPGYHLVLLVMLFWPGSLLAAAAVVRGIRRGTRSRGSGEGGRLKRFGSWCVNLRRGRDAEFFLVAWLLPAWLAFELAGTKLPHYVLPLYPAIALLVARALFAGLDRLPEAQGVMARIGFGLWLVLGIGLALAPAALTILADAKGWWHLQDAGANWWPLASTSPTLVRGLVFVGGALAIAAVVIGYRHLGRGRPVQAVSWALGCAVIAQFLILVVVLPRVSHFWISPRVVALVEHDSGHAPSSSEFPPIASYGFGEDSLVYLTRAKVKMLADVRGFLDRHPDGYVVVRSEQVTELLPGDDMRTVGVVEGFDYADGDSYRLTVLTRAAPRAQLVPSTRAVSSTSRVQLATW